VLAGVLDELSLKGPWNSGETPLAGAAPMAAAGCWLVRRVDSPNAGRRPAVETLAAGPGMIRQFASRDEVMRQAIELARRGIGLVEPKPAGGSGRR